MGIATMSKKNVTACLVVIGNEILSGRTRDANVQYLGSALNDLGVNLTEVRIIPDVEDVIIETVNSVRRCFDYVLTTGGIGPTHDDITSASIAKMFGVALLRNPEAEKLLHAHYKPEDRLPERMKMADIPDGGILIYNPVSAAPGFQLENVFVLPGVPRIMQAMFEGIKDRFTGGDPVRSRTLTSYLPEGVMAGPLAQIQADYPNSDIGSYPFVRDGKIGSSIVIRSTDHGHLNGAAEAVAALMREKGGEPMEDGL